MFLYRLLLIVSIPILGIRMAYALYKNTETIRGIRQRFGGAQDPKSSTPVLWLHGASLGELTAAKALICDLLTAFPDIDLLVSANTLSGKDLVASWQLPRTTTTLAPLDNPLIIRRFMRHWNPIAIVSLENELWPNRVGQATWRGIPFVIVAGRLSAKSAAMWARFPRLAHRVMGSIDALFPMDAANARRFLDLGLHEDRLHAYSNLKSSVVLDQPDATELARFFAIYSRHQTILAASTHPGEEAMILRAFAAGHRADPGLRLILAPRHAKRSAEVADIIQFTGLSYVTRSSGAEPDPDTAVYLADTTGEMALWYSLASDVLLGGSWVAKGGHSPVEPVQFGARIVHGPDIANHAEVYQALASVNASIALNNSDEMVQFFLDVAGHAEEPHNMDRAWQAIEKLRKVSAATGAIIDTISELTRQK